MYTPEDANISTSPRRNTTDLIYKKVQVYKPIATS